MATMTLTLTGLYDWVQSHDEPDLFRDLTVPDSLDATVLKNNILMQAAPFEVAYPDPDVLRIMIGIWSQRNQDKWNRWAEAWEAAAEFNPLENFDRTETENIAHSGTDVTGNTQTRNLAGSDNRTVNLTDERTADLEQTETRNLTDQETRNLTDTETRNLTDEHKVSAFDSSAYAPKDQDTHTGTDTQQHTGTVTNTGTGTDTVATTGTDTTDHTGTDNRATTDTGTVQDSGATTYGHNIARNARYHGNIGVTSLAQLLSSYDEAVETWDLYAVITQDFIKEFCLLVY